MKLDTTEGKQVGVCACVCVHAPVLCVLVEEGGGLAKGEE